MGIRQDKKKHWFCCICLAWLLAPWACLTAEAAEDSAPAQAQQQDNRPFYLRWVARLGLIPAEKHDNRVSVSKFIPVASEPHVNLRYAFESAKMRQSSVDLDFEEKAVQFQLDRVTDVTIKVGSDYYFALSTRW